jgi:hypothetical protein
MFLIVGVCKVSLCINRFYYVQIFLILKTESIEFVWTTLKPQMHSIQRFDLHTTCIISVALPAAHSVM